MSKFLLDENLSPSLAVFLSSLGYHALAVRDTDLKGATDEEIIDWAKKNNVIIVTRDLGFGYTFARTNPSFGLILLRSKDDSTEVFQTILRQLHEKGFLERVQEKPGFIIASQSSIRIYSDKPEN